MARRLRLYCAAAACIFGSIALFRTFLLPRLLQQAQAREGLIFSNGDLGYQSFRIPAVLRLNTSALLAFAEARLTGGDNSHVDLALRRSLDGGKTWAPVQIVAGALSTQGRTVHGNPAPVFDRQTGSVFVVWCMNNSYVFVQESKDAGITWSEARNITEQVKRPGWGWMATGPNHGTQLRSGRLVIPFNTFFEEEKVVVTSRVTGCLNTFECAQFRAKASRSLVTEVEITNPLDPGMPPLRQMLNGTASVPAFVWNGDRSGVFFSDDHGVSWQLGGMVDSRLGSSECAAAETEAGLLLSFRVEDGDTRCRKMALSRDGGAAFEPFFEPGDCIPDPVCQGSLLALEDGRVVTSGPGSKKGRLDLTLFVGREASAGEGAGNPFAFRKLAQVAKGASGYSDIVELGPYADGEPTQVGVLYENGAGLAWVAAAVPGGGGAPTAKAAVA